MPPPVKDTVLKALVLEVISLAGAPELNITVPELWLNTPLFTKLPVIVIVPSGAVPPACNVRLL